MKTPKEIALEFGAMMLDELLPGQTEFHFTESQLNTFAQKWLEANSSELQQSHDRLEAALNGGLGVKVQLNVRRELFNFHCKQDWVNKAQSRYANCGVRKEFYITLDALGRVMRMGKCFENASYPVTVYELATTWA
jgi:hypothetical protein